MAEVNHALVRVPLDTASLANEIRYQGNLFHVLRFEDASGNPLLDGKISVRVGDDFVDPIPLGYNCAIRGPSLTWILSWAAQPGYVAVILISTVDGYSTGLDVDSPPAKQIITAASGAGIASGAVTVAATATLVKAANTTRQRLTVQNRSSDDIYIGPSGVTTATGLYLGPGEAFTVQGSTAAVYAIGAVGSQDVRYLEEA